MIASLIELTYNLAILVALSVISGFIGRRREGKVLGAILQGMLFGAAAVIGMMRPLVFGPGLIFDGRSVMLSLCGLFFGPLAVGVAGGMALLYRLTLGGVGVHMGVSVIASSALLGLLFHHRWTRKEGPLTARRLLGIGLLVHVAMLLLMLTLPAGTGLGVIQRLGLPILLAYPLVTLLIGKILASQAAGLHSMEALRESEGRYRMLTESMKDVVWTLDTQTLRFVYVSPSVLKLRGFTPEEIIAEPLDTALTPEAAEALKAVIRQRVEDFRASGNSPGPFYMDEVEQPCKDGRVVWTEVITNYCLNENTGHVEVRGVTRDITKRKQAEAALRKSEEAYRRLVRDMQVGVLLQGPQSEIVLSNPKALELLGISEDQLLGKTSFDPDWNVIHEDGTPFPGSTHPVPQAIASRQAVRDVVMGVFRPAKGDRAWLLVDAEPQLNADGTVKTAVCTFIDITKRKLAEEALRKSIELLSLLFQHSPIYIFIKAVTPTESRVLQASENFMQMLGIPGSAMIGKTMGELFPAELAEKMTADDWAVVSAGKVLEFAEKLNDRSYATIKFPIIQGEQTLLAGFTIDTTDRKQAEEALQQSERKFRTLFENLAEGVALHELVKDDTGQLLDYRILDVNPAYQLHTGLEAASAPGRLGTEIYGTTVPPYLEQFSQVALGGEPYAFETFFPPLDKHFRISVISPRPGQFATVFEDITDRKRREEELKQKNAEMERFTYMISHDLKSPVVTVQTFLGYLEQDLEQGKTERVAKDMGFIRNATGKMGRLLEDLLEVSRVGRVVNPPVRVSLARLIQEALAAVAGAISTRGVTVQVDASSVILFGDRPRLEEIWQNLVENAVKYLGDQSSPRIALGVEGGGAEAVFFVQDNGMGIDPRYHTKVFGLFEKLDAGSEGTGLGLALVKRIVELHEGRIWLESEGSGQGTCFRFTLPLAMKDHNQGECP